MGVPNKFNSNKFVKILFCVFKNIDFKLSILLKVWFEKNKNKKQAATKFKNTYKYKEPITDKI